MGVLGAVRVGFVLAGLGWLEVGLGCQLDRGTHSLPLKGYSYCPILTKTADCKFYLAVFVQGRRQNVLSDFMKLPQSDTES